jgi:hypothetical protein
MDDRLLILYYNDMYGDLPEIEKYQVKGVESSIDRGRFTEADIVVFQTPNIKFRP